jgi:hypothetical protein
MKDVTNANEADVRAEITDPLLMLLGYERGTVNDIRRELTLNYEYVFLGRKKKTDPPLRGRADYVLVVAGAGRWALDAKAPNEEITRDAVEQAISYARHPEIGGSYAVVTNGRLLVVYSATGTYERGPLIQLDVESPMQLAEKLEGTLSPAAIRRDCSPPKVDLGKPLAEGFRSSANITKGVIRNEAFVWASNFPVPAPAVAGLDEAARKMTGYRSNITGGRVWRDEATSRIKAKLDWTGPHDAVLQFAQDKKLLEIEYVSLDPVVSSDPERPTVFDVVATVRVKEGEVLFDLLRWDTAVANIAAAMTMRGQGAGTIKDGRFAGTFLAEYESTFPTMPGLVLTMAAAGSFEVYLDTK